MHGIAGRSTPNTAPRSRQDGVTLISFLVIAALVLFLSYLAVRILPSYTEYGKVVRIMRTVAEDYQPGETTAFDLRKELALKLRAADIRNVAKRDFKIERTRAGTTLSVSYEVPIHLFGSLGVVAKFDRSVPIGPQKETT